MIQRVGGAWLILMAMLALTAACRDKTAPPAQSSPPPNKLSGANLLPPESWDAIYLQGQKVGYQHTTVAPRQGGKLIEIVSRQRLEVTRNQQTVQMKMRISSVESVDGQVLSFALQAETGPTPIVVEGHIRDQQLHIHSGDQQRTQPWTPETLGFFAVEQQLRRKPLQSGQSRTIRSLIPLLGVPVAETQLTAGSLETVELLSESRELLRIDSRVEIGGQPMETILWTDTEGTVWKSELPALKQVLYRTTQSVATAANESVPLDLAAATTVRLPQPLERPHDMRRAVYRVHHPDRDPATVFVSDDRQTVRPIDERTVEITVVTAAPNAPPGQRATPPGPEALAANEMIQSDDPAIVELARQATADQTDPWQTALACESWVHQAIRAKNFSQGFATASDVARQLEGDCTEHAVLLAALCRARQIPAQVVTGLVYAPSLQGFGFHMWNEVWIGNQWVPLDATLGRGGVGVTHLKLSASDLSLASADAVLLPVLQIMSGLQIEVLDREPVLENHE